MSETLSKIEYRIRPVTRYVVTRYAEEVDESGKLCGKISETKGEFENVGVAYDVGYSLAAQEHQKQGWPVGDMRMTYPSPLPGSAISPPPTAERP